MTISKKILAGAVAASLAVSAMAPVANAEVSASVGAANMYLWRGENLGGGAMVHGSLDYSMSGFYAGIWGGSGDGTYGTEWDTYLGYGGEVSGFTYDVSVWAYNYAETDQDDGGDDSFDAEFDEYSIGLGYGPVSFSYTGAIDGDYTYMTLGASFGDFGVTYGVDSDAGRDLGGDKSHIDFSYSYNDSLGFTISQIIDDAEGELDSSPLFVVSYSMPIE